MLYLLALLSEIVAGSRVFTALAAERGRPPYPPQS